MLSLLLAIAATAPQGSDLDALYDILQEEERITPEVRIVQAVVPAVVFIETEFLAQRNSFGFLFSRSYEGSGSGVVVHPDGYIVTNYHVVAGARAIKVSFARIPGQFEAELVSFKRSEDLALLRIRGDGPFPTVRLGTSSDLLEAERVVAIGNPYGQTHTVSKGIISGLHRDVQVPGQNLVFTDLIQTDASINFGNSGGPLLNIRGELIGINTAMNSQAENIGFAIPVDRVRDVLNDILFPRARRSWLGFELAEDGSRAVGQRLARRARLRSRPILRGRPRPVARRSTTPVQDAEDVPPRHAGDRARRGGRSSHSQCGTAGPSRPRSSPGTASTASCSSAWA